MTTIVTEMLRERNIAVTDAEATLMALGIHADTGSLVCWATDVSVTTHLHPTHTAHTTQKHNHVI